MSTYKFLISKNNIARDSDDNITYDDPNGGEDVTVTLWVDDQEIHAVTLTDAGACLQYTGTLSEGYHTVKIQPEAGKPTDIRIDHVLIDDHRVVGSQYRMDTRIFGKAEDFLKYKACAPFRTPKGSDHVWWGQVFAADYTVTSLTTLYRPHVVTDTGEWWQWSFTVTSSGHVHWTIDDSDSILYDSTENHCFYAAKSILINDSTTFPQVDTDLVDEWRNGQWEDSTTLLPAWNGVGVYNDHFAQATWATTGYEDYTFTSLYSYQEWIDAAYWKTIYWPRHDIDPIVIT